MEQLTAKGYHMYPLSSWRRPKQSFKESDQINNFKLMLLFLWRHLFLLVTYGNLAVYVLHWKLGRCAVYTVANKYTYSLFPCSTGHALW